MKARLELELQQALAAAGMLNFTPATRHFMFSEPDGASPIVVQIEDVRPAIRSEGIECINLERGLSILEAIKSGAPLPPIEVNVPPDLQEPFRFALFNGYHRLNLSAALGFSHIPVVIKPYFNLNAS